MRHSLARLAAGLARAAAATAAAGRGLHVSAAAADASAAAAASAASAGPGSAAAAAAAAADAAAAAGGRAGSFPSWLSSSKTRVTTPLTHALPGVEPEQGYKGPKEPPPTEVTTLSNGVRIVSEASMGPTASMGIYVNSGSIYEDAPSTSGATAMLECLAFKGTTHRDTLRVMKEVEQIGANVAANGSREQMSYTVDCLRTHVPAALELLCDCVVNPALNPDELDEQRRRLEVLLALPDVQLTLLTEALLREAYEGALARPLIPDVAALPGLTPEVLRAFVRSHYTGKRTVLAGAGLPHAQLVDLAAPMLEGLAPGGDDGMKEPPSRYAGAHAHLAGAAPHANLILAFECAGGWRDVQGSVVMTVLTYLLGGGNSFSSGGPGKGMHSRLYTRVLNYHHWVHSCASFSSTMNDTGLVGIQSACEPGRAQQMLDLMCAELESLTRPPPADQLERAKHMAVSLIQGALESKAASAEDLGRQFLTYGHRVSVREYEQMILGVTGKMVAELTRGLLSTKPSLATFGDGADAASYEALLRRYGELTAAAGGVARRLDAAGGGEPPLGGVLERLRALGGGGGGAAAAAAAAASGGRSNRTISSESSSSSSRQQQ